MMKLVWKFSCCIRNLWLLSYSSKQNQPVKLGVSLISHISIKILLIKLTLEHQTGIWKRRNLRLEFRMSVTRYAKRYLRSSKVLRHFKPKQRVDKFLFSLHYPLLSANRIARYFKQDYHLKRSKITLIFRKQINNKKVKVSRYA